MWGAKWIDAQRQSALAQGGPSWAKLPHWQKSLIDFYGYDKLVALAGGLGRRVLRVQRLREWQARDEHRRRVPRRRSSRTSTPSSKYGTAPLPVVDDQPEPLRLGLRHRQPSWASPSSAKHKDAAWLLMKYLALDDHAEAKLSNGLRNVPDHHDGSLNSPEIKNDPKFKVFLDDLRQPEVEHVPDHDGGQCQPGALRVLDREVAGRQGRRPAVRARRRGQADRRAAGERDGHAGAVSSVAGRPRRHRAGPRRRRTGAGPGAGRRGGAGGWSCC